MPAMLLRPVMEKHRAHGALLQGATERAPDGRRQGRHRPAR